MNTATRVNVTTSEALDRALRHAATKMNPLSSWADTLFTISNPDSEIDGGAKKVALKTWLHEGAELDTLQVTLDMTDPDDPKVKSAWSPGLRLMEDVGPTYATWTTGSSIEFKGTHALRASETIWVGGYEWGKNTLVLCIYRAA